MEVRISRRKYKVYAFDIETHNDEESIRNKTTSMWLGCLIDDELKETDQESYYYNMDEVIKKLHDLSTPKRRHGEKKKPCKNICIYVYNLAFEWSFLLPCLLDKGFTYKEEITDEDEYKYNSVTTKSVSSVWNISLKFEKKSGNVIFRDLSKIYGGGLGNVAKSFNIPTQKGIIDYRKNRLHNYVVTEEEKIYCYKDTRIIIDILIEMIRRKDPYFFSSMSMATYSMKMLVNTGYPRSMKPYAEYRKDYPFLDKKETEFLRPAVSGGITYAPSRWQFKDIKQRIVHIDAHSMHPSSAYLNLFPYGVGTYHKGKPTNYCSVANCCHVLVSYDDVKLHSVIALIGTDSITNFELTLWDFEIELMYQCYVNLEVQYIDYYQYEIKPLPWRNYYANCYNKRKEAKAKGDAFAKLYYKLLINSSYGKALERPHLQSFENVVAYDGAIDSIIHDRKIENENMLYNSKYTYLPYGSMIPAYSRVCLVKLALKIGWESVVYFDTDSIFFIETPQTLENMRKYMPTQDFLGGWAIEEILTRAQFTAPKRYKGQTEEGQVYIKSGGINFKSYIEARAKEQGINDINQIQEFTDKYAFNFDEINIINNNIKVQRAYRVKGGTIIEFQDKEIKVPAKYQEIYNKNML